MSKTKQYIEDMMEQVIKMVKQSELVNYLSDGFTLGRLSFKNKSK
jgi:hypothetical protein